MNNKKEKTQNQSNTGGPQRTDNSADLTKYSLDGKLYAHGRAPNPYFPPQNAPAGGASRRVTPMLDVDTSVNDRPSSKPVTQIPVKPSGRNQSGPAPRDSMRIDLPPNPYINNNTEYQDVSHSQNGNNQNPAANYGGKWIVVGGLPRNIQMYYPGQTIYPYAPKQNIHDPEVIHGANGFMPAGLSQDPRMNYAGHHMPPRAQNQNIQSAVAPPRRNRTALAEQDKILAAPPPNPPTSHPEHYMPEASLQNIHNPVAVPGGSQSTPVQQGNMVSGPPHMNDLPQPQFYQYPQTWDTASIHRWMGGTGPPGILSGQEIPYAARLQQNHIYELSSAQTQQYNYLPSGPSHGAIPFPQSHGPPQYEENVMQQPIPPQPSVNNLQPRYPDQPTSIGVFPLRPASTAGHISSEGTFPITTHPGPSQVFFRVRSSGTATKYSTPLKNDAQGAINPHSNDIPIPGENLLGPETNSVVRQNQNSSQRGSNDATPQGATSLPGGITTFGPDDPQESIEKDDSSSPREINTVAQSSGTKPSLRNLQQTTDNNELQIPRMRDFSTSPRIDEPEVREHGETIAGRQLLEHRGLQGRKRHRPEQEPFMQQPTPTSPTRDNAHSGYIRSRSGSLLRTRSNHPNNSEANDFERDGNPQKAREHKRSRNEYSRDSAVDDSRDRRDPWARLVDLADAAALRGSEDGPSTAFWGNRRRVELTPIGTAAPTIPLDTHASMYGPFGDGSMNNSMGGYALPAAGASTAPAGAPRPKNYFVSGKSIKLRLDGKPRGSPRDKPRGTGRRRGRPPKSRSDGTPRGTPRDKSRGTGRPRSRTKSKPEGSVRKPVIESSRSEDSQYPFSGDVRISPGANIYASNLVSSTRTQSPPGHRFNRNIRRTPEPSGFRRNENLPPGEDRRDPTTPEAADLQNMWHSPSPQEAGERRFLRTEQDRQDLETARAKRKKRDDEEMYQGLINSQRPQRGFNGQRESDRQETIRKRHDNEVAKNERQARRERERTLAHRPRVGDKPVSIEQLRKVSDTVCKHHTALRLFGSSC
ncbi:hypothetical protein V8E51_006451 [Hyaloscypha variabilis]